MLRKPEVTTTRVPPLKALEVNDQYGQKNGSGVVCKMNHCKIGVLDFDAVRSRYLAQLTIPSDVT